MCASLWLPARRLRDHARSHLRALYIAARFPACFSFFLISLITRYSASFGFYAFASRLLRLCVSSAAPLRLWCSLCSGLLLLSTRHCTAHLFSALLFSSLHCTSGLLILFLTLGVRPRYNILIIIPINFDGNICLLNVFFAKTYFI